MPIDELGSIACWRVVQAKSLDMDEATHFVFRGRISCESFTEFARHRAQRLALDIEVGRCDEACAAVAVRGPEDLVDAFEMACSLGPWDCLVLDVARSE